MGALKPAAEMRESQFVSEFSCTFGNNETIANPRSIPGKESATFDH